MHIYTLVDILKNASLLEDKGIYFIKTKEEKFISYRQLYDEAIKMLGFLQKSGIEPGDTVIFQIDDNEEFIKCFWAAILGGIVPIPVSVGNADEMVEKMIRIWNILRKPYLITKKHVMENISQYCREKNESNIFGITFGATQFTFHI